MKDRGGAAIFCCYGYQDRLGPNGRSYERTSFVAVPLTENGRVLSWRADNLPSFTFCHVSQTFEELFSPRFSRLDAQWIDLCIDVFIVAIGLVVAEILPF